jgi:hypothetical protein
LERTLAKNLEDSMRKALTVVFISTLCLAAQTISITGTVSNTSNQPLQGVIVQLLASQVKDTTDANGNYSLSGTGTAALLPPRGLTEFNEIMYRNGRFDFSATSPVSVSARLYSLSGRLEARVFDGVLQQGLTEVPFTSSRMGRNIYLLKVRSADKTVVYKLSPLSGGTFQLSGMSTMSGTSGLAKAAAVDWLQATKQGYASHVEQIASTSGVINITLSAPVAPNFGPNVYVFDPSMTTIQSQLTSIYNQQQGAQFGTGRCAFLFKPGKYNVSVLLGFYTEVLGLGLTPDSVQITGAVESDAYLSGGNATCNFWRSCAGIAVTPSSGTDLWAVSQACPMRRMHIKGNLAIAPSGGAGSGGFIGDCKVDGSISGWQEQWFSRNSQYNGWTSGGWNFVFVGAANPPAGTWPNQPYTVVPKTPIIREKPFLFIDNSGSYSVMVPDLRKDSTIGITWTSGTTPGGSVPIDLFYIARSASDNAASINAALAQGKNLLVTPGIYNLEASIKVTRPGTIVLGIGMPSLVPQNGTPALEASDVDGLKIGGFIVDASAANSASLVVIGESGSTTDHSSDPTSLWDIFCRVGGQFSGSASCMLTINSNNVIGDHFWLWRADHGTGVGWNSNKNNNGLIVNGNNVTMYGLFVEHTQQYQALWNGNGCRNYFMQCEFPYDVPNQASWMAGTTNGYASYKVAASVTSHEAWALGAYAFFNQSPVVLDNAIEVPANVAGIKMHNLCTVTLGGNQGTVTHIINGTGSAVTPSSAQVARVTSYP